MTQKLPKEIEEILVYQKLHKAPTEEGVRQLVLGICVFVNNCRNCTVEINGDFVQINLMRFKGLKGIYHKLLKKDRLSEFQNESILKLVKFWLSFMENPVLSVSWK
jgi:hypothetical protein